MQVLVCTYKLKNNSKSTSGQDGSIGRYTLSPHTTKKDNKLKNNNNKKTQNCQKIELRGSSTTKELKNKYSSRLVGGARTRGGGVERTGNKAAATGPGGPTFSCR